jgi:uncharacterized protein (DUF2147 family)
MRILSGASAALCFCMLAVCAPEADLTPVGRWKTIDDKTGNPKAIVRIYEDHGRLFGRIEQSLNPKAGKFCDKCKDERKGQPIAGLVIMRGLTKRGQEYSGGDILDPDNGSVYRCKLRLEDQGKKLSVRGYLGFSLLGRSQTWIREP